MLSIIIKIIIVGVVLWFVNMYIPMDEGIKKILYTVVVIVLILWLLLAFGVIVPNMFIKSIK